MTERAVERREVVRDLLPCDVHIADARGHLGRHALGDEALPQDPLILDGGERLVQIPYVHAGPHVFARELLEAAAVRRGHLGVFAPRRGGHDELAQRAVEHRGQEPVERVPDIGEQPQVDAELSDGLEGPHPGRADELLC
ncbi:MAG: hypothetical protein ABL886_15290, partial [Rhodoglobus sp.]